MPGISFIYDNNNHIKKIESFFSNSSHSISYEDEYKNQILLKRTNYCLICSKYSGYPTTTFENENYFIHLEGKIYNKKYSLLEKELNALAATIFSNNLVSDHLLQWASTTDGDFIVFMFDKKFNKIAIVSDPLGLLPLYYYHHNNCLVVSREIRLIINLIGKKDINMAALAEYLLFGYTLGQNTLLKDIFRMKPASLLKVNLNNFELNNLTYDFFNFDNNNHYYGQAIEDNVNILASLFIEACRNRGCFEGHNNLLSLSGGLDSRLVAAGLSINKIPFQGVTFLSHNKVEHIDATIAEQVANFFDINWKLFQLSPTKGKYFLQLLRMKNGLNYLGMSFILPFFEKIIEAYGKNIIYFTGDMTLGLLNNLPSKKLKTIEDLMNYILYKNAIFSLEDVSSLLNLKKIEILDILRNHLVNYPENNLMQKYVHFKIYDKTFNWLSEGMDRNRYYFWLATPLLSPKVFKYCINCPEEQKSYFRLYRDFLIKLSPKSAIFNYANYNLPVTSNTFIIKEFLSSFYNDKFPTAIKILTRKYLLKHWSLYEYNSNIMNCFQEQLRNSEQIKAYFSLPKLLSTIQKCNQFQFNILFTITSLIEEIELNHSSIEKYSEIELV